jgi:uncharacterized protein YjdB
VATVSGSGLVTGVAAGPATITATSEGQSGVATVTVTNVPVASVAVSPASASVTVAQTVQLTATPKDAAGNPLLGRVVTWASSNTTVATVSGSGLVSGVATGAATITALSEGQSGAATVTVTIVPVASVAVSPAAASVALGQTVQLTATPKDVSGTPLSGRVVSWASSNTTVATVSGSGLVSGVATGAATITALSEGQSGTAAITVTVAVSNPGTVTNLAIAGVTDTSVTLSFTEVSDGTGQSASYEIRLAAGALSWGSAATVTRGSCATPVAGSVIGASRTCTVLGLVASTGYQFQLVAFRGTLNLNAVFGALSNVASGTTAASTAPVASVTVSPATASVTVGQTAQLTATPKDVNGNPLSGRVVTWASSNSALAMVSGSGLVSGVVVGSVTITATSEGKSGTAVVTVTVPPPPPAAGTWPNEPAGMTVLSDYGMDQPIPTIGDVPILGSGGWHAVSNTGGGASLSSDASAPVSPPGVYQFIYPIGSHDGSAPGTVYFTMNAAELYCGFYWKPSNPWQTDPSGTNKIAFLFIGGRTNFISMHSYGTYYALQVQNEIISVNYDPNVTTTPITLGQWHRIEWYVNAVTGAMKVWLDGVLQTDVVSSFPGNFTMFQFSPTWGGNVGAVKTETDYYWYDHVHLSGR